MVDKFVVGKQYRMSAQGTIYTCVHVDGDCGVMIYDSHSGKLRSLAFHKPKVFTEYKEPRKGSYWIAVYDRDGFITHTQGTKEVIDAWIDDNPFDILAIKCITWTEGDRDG